MVKENGYNGWSNYETWNVKLWMDNDQGSREYWKEQTLEAFGRAADKDEALYKLSEAIKDAHEEQAQDALEAAKVESSWISDILNGSIREVDWYEIAESLYDDNKEDIEEDKEKEQ